MVKLPSGQTVLLDGAHNPAGVESLRAALAAEFPGARPTLIFGVLADKDWKTLCARLAPLAGRLLLVPLKSERALPPGDLLPACREANPRAAVAVCPSLADALRASEGDPFVVVTGSLYLIGEAMERLGLSSSPARNERDLNEWNQGNSPSRPRS